MYTIVNAQLGIAYGTIFPEITIGEDEVKRISMQAPMLVSNERMTRYFRELFKSFRIEKFSDLVGQNVQIFKDQIQQQIVAIAPEQNPTTIFDPQDISDMPASALCHTNGQCRVSGAIFVMSIKTVDIVLANLTGEEQFYILIELNSAVSVNTNPTYHIPLSVENVLTLMSMCRTVTLKGITHKPMKFQLYKDYIKLRNGMPNTPEQWFEFPIVQL